MSGSHICKPCFVLSTNSRTTYHQDSKNPLFCIPYFPNFHKRLLSNFSVTTMFNFPSTRTNVSIVPLFCCSKYSSNDILQIGIGRPREIGLFPTYTIHPHQQNRFGRPREIELSQTYTTHSHSGGGPREIGPPKKSSNVLSTNGTIKSVADHCGTREIGLTLYQSQHKELGRPREIGLLPTHTHKDPNKPSEIWLCQPGKLNIQEEGPREIGFPQEIPLKGIEGNTPTLLRDAESHSHNENGQTSYSKAPPPKPRIGPWIGHTKQSESNWHRTNTINRGDRTHTGLV